MQTDSKLESVNIEKLKEILNEAEFDVSNEIISSIKDLLEEFIKEKDKKDSEFYKFLFSRIEESDIRDRIASQFSPDIFYSLGKKLLEKSDPIIIESYLDIFRSPNILTRIYGDTLWPELILNLLESINYTFPKLFKHRMRKYADKVLFTIMESESQKDITWREVDKNVKSICKGLYALLGDNASKKKVAFLCENSIEMVYFDLACLTSGIVNVMIPANSTPDQIEYILKITEPEIIIISRGQLLKKLRNFRKNLLFLKWIILFKKVIPWEKDYISINGLQEKGQNLDESVISDSLNKLKFSDLVSIMFTSGTTGNPKGIMFSHQNIVFKRFARAMAIPKIGENDIFLSYLPLYHTFGRWFEMTGSIFWNARYVFMENPSVEAMVNNMQRIKPSIFISIPKKWYQLYERVSQTVDLEHGDDKTIHKVLINITGGNLKWGLSAAGHLDSEIFQFFQHNGVELMSGFGMTEATGGITMTPPGKYLPGSLGKALPGIDLQVANDGELLIKGPYVMMNYFNPEDSDAKFEDGWLSTGDIMKMDTEGFIEIIDRKKEIYKNIKGETIAPQKIENFFGEFEFIKNVFLVGDHRHYNTILIYPNYKSTQVNFENMNQNELYDYFSSVVVSVNKFLASFERIVDYRVIEREFDAAKGELTPKGTYKRSIIEQNFGSIIDPMYGRNYTAVLCDNLEIRIQNWFLREKGVTANELNFEKNKLKLTDQKWDLTIRIHKDGIQVGNCLYKINEKYLDLGKILNNPVLWLGNEQIVNFAGENIFKWSKNDEVINNIFFSNMIDDKSSYYINKELLQSLLYKKEYSFFGMHLAALGLSAKKYDESKICVDYLKQLAINNKSGFLFYVVEILKRSTIVSNLNVQRNSFCALIELIDDDHFYNVFKKFNDIDTYFINPEVISEIAKMNLSNSKIESLMNLMQVYITMGDMRLVPLFGLIGKYGAGHPSKFKIFRQYLVQFQHSTIDEKIRKTARNARLDMRSGFRYWLGKVHQIAVDIETGNEYTWDDVVIFEEDIAEEYKTKILQAIKNAAIIREAVFLFSRGIKLQLDDIPLGGIWISLLGKEHEKSVYRVSIQTRFQGSFDFALNVNTGLEYLQITEEVEWLIRSGTVYEGKKLVEDFGGYWDDYDMWSEEFIHGETTGKFLKRVSKQKNESYKKRAKNLWPFFIWSGLSAYIDFWQRTNQTLEIADPSVENIIIPAHDYQTGSRIVSISERKKHKSLLDLLINFYRNFVEQSEEKYEFLKGDNHWQYIFSAFPDTFGLIKGKQVLNEFCEEVNKQKQTVFYQLLRNELNQFLKDLIENGFIPKTLFFAIRRYKRWLELNKNATSQARASTLSELYNTYNLSQLEESFPETRTVFFTKTVFENTNAELYEKLKSIIEEQRSTTITNDNLLKELNSIQKQMKLTEEEQFFLTRLSYPYLKPEDSAEIISLDSGGELRANLVVKYEDLEGNIFSVREPVNPKEITRLHQLYIKNKLQVQFRPEHQFLIAVNERGYLIGGIYYKIIDKQVSHLEKIVVENHYRKKGVSDILMNEFFKRLQNLNFEMVTTGFFRPEYFYRFDFKIERKYAGLVKNLSNFKQSENLSDKE
jgi:long-subunit acyl-CoA synthetase (AMP-forming)/N-acetylglutamate synthase-like GNAT family acetyltransferase